MIDKHEEINFKKNFCEKYFDEETWDLDVLNEVDVLLKDSKGRKLLYLEAKYAIESLAEHRQALAQVILTNKKQDAILSHVALIYQDANKNDVLELIDCSEDSVMYNNDFNWKAEKPSSPSRDAIDRINDRLIGKITQYKNDEIAEFYAEFKNNGNTQIQITARNFNVVYNSWKNEVDFKEDVRDEQILINLFLTDILNGTVYKKNVVEDLQNKTTQQVNPKNGNLLLFADEDQELVREGINLGNYAITYTKTTQPDGIKYFGGRVSYYFTIDNYDKYTFFWKKYQRPPERTEFLKILERSATLYSDKYRKDTGGEYTPTCFVEKQNQILRQHYNLDEYVIFDPCAGVGNLENQFGFEYKENVFLSTLEIIDVDICKIKGFNYAVQFDYLKNNEHPRWNYKGYNLSINEICKMENKKLMVIMNPPYQNKKEHQYDMAIEFFKKVTTLKPDVIVYYCKTEFFLRDTVKIYADSGYNIVSHIFANARDTFQLSKWSASQVIFDRENGTPIDENHITADRYDYNKKTDQLDFVKSYTYDNSRPNLVKEIEKKIKENAKGIILGQWVNQMYCIVISNRQTHKQLITEQNLKYALLLKGINFNTDAKCFETSNLTYRGKFEEISDELFNDCILFSQFYIGCNFSNKEGRKNFIMPFTNKELGCAKNNLNVLIPQYETNLSILSEDENTEKPFDFREFFHSFEYSQEAQDLYFAALRIFRWYHSNKNFQNKDWNDSFYDITNAIMGKDSESFSDLQSKKDKRITKVKTTKGTKGFSRTTIKYAVSSEDLPMFIDFFDKRDALAVKINKQLVKEGLLLWERENIY